jgi:hypothetical protein
MCRALLIATLIVVGSFSGSASADPLTAWSMNASSCTPALPSATAYSVSGGAIISVSLNSTFYCSIPYNLRQSHGTSNTLLLTYKGNSNYTGCTGICPAQKWITASVIALSRTTGTESVVATLISATSATVATQGLRFTYAFDFDANFYYVVLKASGDGGTYTQYAYGVAIQDS